MNQYPRRYAVRITPVQRPSTSEAEARARKVALYVEGIRHHRLEEACPIARWSDDAWEKVRLYIETRGGRGRLNPASVTTRVAIAAELQRLRVLDRQCGWCQQPIGDSEAAQTSAVVGRIHEACGPAVCKAVRDGALAQLRAERS